MTGFPRMLALLALLGSGGLYAQEQLGDDSQATPSQTTPSNSTPDIIEGDQNVGAAKVPEGQELVNINFPDETDIKDIIRAVSLWTGKNVILGKNVQGKVQMISPKRVTKEEAYQAFLSALNVLGLTTVETGKVIKVLPLRNAIRDNLQIYQGSSWAPRTDKMITQIVPLRYIDASDLQKTLSRIVTTNSMIPYSPTNTLIISDTGYKVRRVLAIIELLDVQGQQPQVALVPIRYADAKSIADKVGEILKAGGASATAKAPASSKGGYRSFKVFVDERSNSVVIFGPPRTINDVKNLVKKFDFPVEDPANQSAIRVRFLDYADAKKLATTLMSLTTGSSSSARNRVRSITNRTNTKTASKSSSSPVAQLGENVKITADESSNALLITGSRSAYESINMLVRKLDQRRSQVYVEADILDIKDTGDFKFGTSIFAGSGKPNGTKMAYGWQGSKIAPVIAAQTEDNQSASTAEKVAGAFSQDLTIGVLSGQQVEVPGIKGKISPGALITLIKSDDNTRVLSSPHLLTANNEKAKISVGDTLFYKSSQQSAVAGAGSIPKIEKEDVDLTLSIKPNISHSGNYVTMQIDLEANEGGLRTDGDQKLPDINKRSTSQLVTVRNSQTAVISGLMKTREFENYAKIPLLGDIPILGWLFRNTQIRKETTSLLIFMTPHIVYGANDLAKIYEQKLNERDELLADAYGSDFREEQFITRLPKLEDGKFVGNTFDEIEDQRRSQLLDEMRRDMGYIDESVPSGTKEGGPDVAPTTVPIIPSDEGGASFGGDVIEDRPPEVEPMDQDPPDENPPMSEPELNE